MELGVYGIGADMESGGYGIRPYSTFEWLFNLSNAHFLGLSMNNFVARFVC